MTRLINTQMEDIILASIIELYTNSSAEGKIKITNSLIASVEEALQIKLTERERKHIQNKLYKLSSNSAQVNPWLRPRLSLCPKTDKTLFKHFVATNAECIYCNLYKQQCSEKDMIISSLQQKIKGLEREIAQLTNLKTDKNVEKIEFTLGVLSEGLSYEQASCFLC
ncbi:hypothetical protein TRFO_33432 [Tritrichomonas foetus]|uniref:Uncharacterized protein n=1 Tax=Tritrichomonas foetus TaxID=1144522 RepID=A0A1J4JMT9_9EUKA|nr:hypothetical protein TRFO_33432 [Tritrichomonas foetus]|eukprot:OHT00010.1 hypothetical protein TRFO_33432 [Tritrichomonas foetus]